VWERSSFIVKLAPNGWKEMYSIKATGGEGVRENVADTKEGEKAPNKKRHNSTWARLIRKVYGVYLLTCPRCGSEMNILAIILDQEEIKKILAHIVKIGRSPPNFNAASLN
jgi:hypothetical protein